MGGLFCGYRTTEAGFGEMIIAEEEGMTGALRSKGKWEMFKSWGWTEVVSRRG